MNLSCIDATQNIRIWTPPSKSTKINVGELETILGPLPKDFMITIDDFDFIIFEIDWEDRRIDFMRDYKGD